MRIVCNREKLLSAFQVAATVANARSPREILQNVKLVVGQDSTTLMATDMENGIRITVDEVQIEQDGGGVLLPVARFGLILRESHSDTIVITTSRTETVIETERSSFRLPSANPDEYPNVEAFKEDEYHELSVRTLRELIRRTSFAIDVDNSRYALSGVLFEMNGDQVFAVGTDGRRLARMAGTGLAISGHETKPSHTIVPVRGLALVTKAISDLPDDEKVEFAARANDIVVRTIKSTVTCRLVEGRFPNWKNVLPSRKNDTQIDLLAGPFLSAIRQAAIVADAKTHGLDFHFEAGQLVISARTANLGASRVSLPIEHDGKAAIVMKLDYRYVSDFLRMLDADSICTANMASSSESMLLTTDDGYQYVVMPMALER